MNAVRRIPLDRRVMVIRENRIDLRPERAAVIFPLIGLCIAVLLFGAVVAFAKDLSATTLALILLPALLIAPFSAMALVYSLIGASMVVEKAKQSVRFHQGVLGLGIGTVELVPFWKIEHVEVEDFRLGDVNARLPRPVLDMRAWDIVLVKKSGKRLPIAQVISANSPDLIEEGWDRTLDAAEALAQMTGSEVVITAAVEEPLLEEQAEAPGVPPREEPTTRAGSADQALTDSR
jgi:hypothetical protein